MKNEIEITKADVTHKMTLPDNTCIAYTGGSYDRYDDIYGCGAVLLLPDHSVLQMHTSAVPSPDETGWNVSAELNAALMAMEFAIEQQYTKISIFHRLDGVGYWPNRVWKTKTPYVQKYVKNVARYRKQIDIEFRHVTRYSGDYWDELAAREASLAIQLALGISPEDEPEFARKSKFPSYPKGITATCRTSLANFYMTSDHSFEDYIELKTGGMDKFSRMKQDEMEEALGPDISAFIRNRVHEESAYPSALRWAMRGLSASDAAHKANVDLEVSANVQLSRRY